jgi:hypothetical protein
MFKRNAFTFACSLPRRRFLATGTAVLTGLMLSPAAYSLAAHDELAESELASFMRVSRRLTGHTDLDPKLGESMYRAILPRDSRAGDALGEIEARLGDPPHEWTDDAQHLARQILKGWYLGIVGEGADATVVTYERALMFGAVAGALVPRSSCLGSPESWTSLPAKGGA